MRVRWEPVPPLHAPLPLRLLRIRQQAFGAPLHAHEALELTWIERGRGLRFVGGSVEPFGDGDLVLLGARLPHTWLTQGPQHGTVAATVLQWQPSAALQSLPGWGAWEALAARAAQGLVLTGPWQAEVIERLQRLPPPAEAQAAGSLRALGALVELLGLLSEAEASAWRSLNPQAGARRAPPRQAAQAGRLEGLLAWVRQHLDAELPAREAAERLGVSPAAFARSFRRQVGKPFATYVNDLRIAQACLLLRDPALPVAEVAQRCGYATLSHFNAQFRLRGGLTPRDYRSRMSAESSTRGSVAAPPPKVKGPASGASGR